jgi:hypothetical protein
MLATAAERQQRGEAPDPAFTAEFRAIARRYVRRTMLSKRALEPLGAARRQYVRKYLLRSQVPDAGPIAPGVQSALAQLGRAMQRYVVKPTTHKGGFVVHAPTGDVAVKLYEWEMYQTLASGFRETVQRRSRFALHKSDGAPFKPVDPLSSTEPAVVLHGLLLRALYLPFGRCPFDGCGAIFVPVVRKQRFCSPEHRKAEWHARVMKARGKEGLERRRKAGRRARAHEKKQASGTWQRERAPGAGRPRKERTDGLST